MKNRKIILFLILVVSITTISCFSKKSKSIDDARFITYEVDLKKQSLQLYWKNDSNVSFRNIENLKAWLDSKRTKLLFAMNGGMFKSDNSPVGLFIQNKKIVVPLDTASGNGNFYLKPNGVFYITTDNEANICSTEKFNDSNKINYATQSGPMLVIDENIHPAFKQGSSNLQVRNGVGILPDGRVVFAMSKDKISFYDFAEYFKELGCKNALYLDGFVSRTYLPEKNWTQTDGNFGVIIGVTAK